jgi:hypothetical protein
MGCCPPAASWKSLVNATIVQRNGFSCLAVPAKRNGGEDGDGVRFDAPGCVHGLGTPYEEWLTL